LPEIADTGRYVGLEVPRDDGRTGDDSAGAEFGKFRRITKLDKNNFVGLCPGSNMKEPSVQAGFVVPKTATLSFWESELEKSYGVALSHRLDL
jgi:hypothetical protein